MPKFMHSAAAQSSSAAMEHYRKVRREQRRRYYAQTAFLYPARRWTDWEDEMVLASTMTDRELSETLQRSMKSISNRRWRLKARMRTDE